MAESEHNRCVLELFDAALDLSCAAREAFLDAECRDQLTLKEEVQSLLGVDERARENGFMDQSALQVRAKQVIRQFQYWLKEATRTSKLKVEMENVGTQTEQCSTKNAET